jgi:hypothetical protein
VSGATFFRKFSSATKNFPEKELTPVSSCKFDLPIAIWNDHRQNSTAARSPFSSPFEPTLDARIVGENNTTTATDSCVPRVVAKMFFAPRSR